MCNKGFENTEDIKTHVKDEHKEVLDYVKDDKEAETSVDEYDYYEGFDENGKQIINNE